MATDSFASLMTTEGGSDRARRRLTKGEVIDATVMQVAGEFVFIDVGMPSDGRIPRVDLLDAEGKVRVAVGDRLRVSVVEPRFEGSLCKALGQAAPAGGDAPVGNEVLAGKITRVEKFGVFVSTAKGDGLIPIRELPLPPGSDHRKLFSVGQRADRGRARRECARASCASALHASRAWKKSKTSVTSPRELPNPACLRPKRRRPSPKRIRRRSRPRRSASAASVI